MQHSHLVTVEPVHPLGPTELAAIERYRYYTGHFLQFGRGVA